jgi:hypothetical protein
MHYALAWLNLKLGNESSYIFFIGLCSRVRRVHRARRTSMVNRVSSFTVSRISGIAEVSVVNRVSMVNRISRVSSCIIGSAGSAGSARLYSMVKRICTILRSHICSLADSMFNRIKKNWTREHNWTLQSHQLSLLETLQLQSHFTSGICKIISPCVLITLLYYLQIRLVSFITIGISPPFPTLPHQESKSPAVAARDTSVRAVTQALTNHESPCPALLHCCYTVVTLLLHCCYTVVTLLSHCCYTVVTVLFHCCYTVVIHCCHTVVHCCHNIVTLLVHFCYTLVTLLSHTHTHTHTHTHLRCVPRL